MKNVSKFLFTICLLVITHGLSFAQLKNFNTESGRWLPGKVILFDGTVLKGSVNYNFITGILSLEDKNVVQTYRADKASYFDYEEPNSQLKQFYSLPYEIRKNKELKNLFFEVVYQNDTIAILSRHVYDYKLRGTGGGRSDVPVKEDRTIEIEKVSEFLYLALGDSPILEFANRKKDRSTTLIYDTVNKLDQTKYENSTTARNENDEYRISNPEAYAFIGGQGHEEHKTSCESLGYQLNTVKGLIYYIDYCLNFKKP